LCNNEVIVVLSTICKTHATINGFPFASPIPQANLAMPMRRMVNNNSGVSGVCLGT
jgi:hypothetical protein